MTTGSYRGWIDGVKRANRLATRATNNMGAR